MKIAIICCKPDKAGMNIKEHLLLEFKETDETFHGERVFEKQLYSSTLKIYTLEKESIYNEDIDKEIEADLFVFATKHRSKQEVPSLSVHSPGNWSDDNSHGGRPYQLCIAPATYLKLALLKLNELGKNTEFEVTLEQTHHGPYLEKPVMFIEIGSTEKQWTNKKAGEIIARTITSMFSGNIPKYKTAIVLGGGHYNQVVTKVMLKTEYAVSHICAKHMLGYLNNDLLNQAINKTMEKVDLVILDWKGLGPHKKKIVQLLDHMLSLIHI